MGQAQGQLKHDEAAAAGGLPPPVLVVDSDCEHKLKWISPRSTSFKRLLEYERDQLGGELAADDDHRHKRSSGLGSSPVVSSSETSDGETTSPESDVGSWGHWYDEGAHSSVESDSDREAFLPVGMGQLEVAVPTPEHILEESLSTQALWHCSVNRHRFGSDGDLDLELEELPPSASPAPRTAEGDKFGLPAARPSTGSALTAAAEAAATAESVPDRDPQCGGCTKTRRRQRVLYRARSPFGTSVTKTFECAHCGQSTPLMVHVPKFQIVECHDDVHAEFLVVVGLGHVTIGVWRRFSQFQLLAERLFSAAPAPPQQPATPHPSPGHAPADDAADKFRMARFSWQCLKRRKRLFRCLDKDYLALKCFLLERFLHDVVFECSSPAIIRDFIGVSVHHPLPSKSKKRRRRVPSNFSLSHDGSVGAPHCAAAE